MELFKTRTIKPESLYLVAVISAVLIWSVSFVATKIAYTTFPPLTLGALRFVLASFILWGILVVKKQFIKPPSKDIGRLMLSGILGITIYFAMENIGVKLTTASNAALIVASYPALTLFLEGIFYRTKISWMKVLGITLAVAGVYLIVQRNQDVGGGDQVLGNLILVGTGIVWAFYNFVTRSVVKKYPMLVVSFYQTVTGTIAFIPLALTEKTQWRAPTLTSFLMLLFLGIFCSVIAFLLYNYGLRKLSSSSAVALMNLVPVFGVLFAVLFLDETINLVQLSGGVIVVVGVMFSAREVIDKSENKTALEKADSSKD